MALAGMGINKLSEATVGAAMTWETQAVSMEHWLKGNKALAQEATSWLEQFAAATPFGMDDLFPAMTRGIGVSKGDIGMAERMVTIATDMAALTPGKTIGDAMEAIADAQNGEMERMTEFNVKMGQEEFQKLGGFTGFLKKMEGTFAGGAQKLSLTAIGKISTITDTINTLFRSTGMGILESMKPRLDKITGWFDSNKDTVARWKDNLITFGKQASEALFSRMESAFNYVRTRYLDNPTFQNLEFWGKVKFIMDDITTEFNKWLDGGGAAAIANFGQKVGTFIGQGVMVVAPSIGKLAAEGVMTAFKVALESSPLGAAILGGLAGGAIGGPWGAGVGTGSGLTAWGVNKAYDFGKSLRQKSSSNTNTLKMLPAHSKAMGISYVPYDNYPANLHRGEKVLTRAEADQHRSSAGSGSQQTFYVTIQGMNKTTKQIFDEMLDIAYAAHSNSGMA